MTLEQFEYAMVLYKDISWNKSYLKTLADGMRLDLDTLFSKEETEQKRKDYIANLQEKTNKMQEELDKLLKGE